jgi:hypothetical protein
MTARGRDIVTSLQSHSRKETAVPFKPASGAHYFLVAAHSGKVLEVKDASDANGAIIQTAEPKPLKTSNHQQWAFNRNSDRVWVLRSRGSQKVIDVQGNSADDGATVHQWDWHGVDSERFLIIDAGDGTFYLQFLHSGKVLDVAGASKDAGVRVVQHRNHFNNQNQHQRFRAVLADEKFEPSNLPGFTNPSQMIRDLTLGLAGLIPTAGGAVRAVTAFFWKDAGPSMIWNQVTHYIDQYIEQRLSQERLKTLGDAIAGAKKNMEDFNGMEPGEPKANTLDATIRVINSADQPFFRDTDPENTIKYLVAMGTIKLTLLQEQACHYPAIAGRTDHPNRAVHFAALRREIAEYTAAAQRLREAAIKERCARIGNDFRLPQPGPTTFDAILRDAVPGIDGHQEMCLRITEPESITVAGRETAKARLRKAREKCIEGQLGAELDAILAPARLWASFDPEAKHPPEKSTVTAKVGPYGTVGHVSTSSGQIEQITMWADDQIRGIQVTCRGGNRGNSIMVGVERGQKSELVLANDEHITGAYGSIFHDVRSLTFETSRGHRVSAGPWSSGFRFQADLVPDIKPRLGAIAASPTGNGISSIEFHWNYDLEGEYPPPRARLEAGKKLNAGETAAEPASP